MMPLFCLGWASSRDANNSRDVGASVSKRRRRLHSSAGRLMRGVEASHWRGLIDRRCRPIRRLADFVAGGGGGGFRLLSAEILLFGGGGDCSHDGLAPGHDLLSRASRRCFASSFGASRRYRGDRAQLLSRRRIASRADHAWRSSSRFGCSARPSRIRSLRRRELLPGAGLRGH